MDQSNVTTRQQKKTGKQPEQSSAAGSTASSGEMTAAQSGYLTGFSAQNPQDPSNSPSSNLSSRLDIKQLVANAMNKAIQLSRERMLALQQSRGEKPTPQAEFLPEIPAENAQDPHTSKRHMPTETTSSTGERPTAKTGFLAKFSAEKPQHPRQPSHYSNIELKSTPQQRGIRSQLADQGYEPHFGGEPTQYGSQSRTAVMRWRPEESRTYAWFKVYATFRKKIGETSPFCSHCRPKFSIFSCRKRPGNWQMALERSNRIQINGCMGACRDSTLMRSQILINSPNSPAA